MAAVMPMPRGARIHDRAAPALQPTPRAQLDEYGKVLDSEIRVTGKCLAHHRKKLNDMRDQDLCTHLTQYPGATTRPCHARVPAWASSPGSPHVPRSAWNPGTPSSVVGAARCEADRSAG